MIIILFLIGLSFALSVIFAGMEMAYLSCNKLKLRHLADEGNKNGILAMAFHREPKRFLTTVLIGNNLTHVSMTSLATYLLGEKMHITNEWVIVAIIAPFIIIFAETVPKDRSEEHTSELQSQSN